MSHYLQHSSALLFPITPTIDFSPRRSLSYGYAAVIHVNDKVFATVEQVSEFLKSIGADGGKIVRLNDCEFSKEATRYFLDNLPDDVEISRFTGLDFVDNEDSLKRFFARRSDIKAITFESCNFGEIDLCEILQGQKDLQTLIISNSALSDESSFSLARLLKALPYLRTLSLNSSLILERGYQAITVALGEDVSRLRKLYFGEVDCDKEEFLKGLKHLAKNPFIVDIMLPAAQKSEESEVLKKEIIERNRKIKEIILNYYALIPVIRLARAVIKSGTSRDIEIKHTEEDIFDFTLMHLFDGLPYAEAIELLEVAKPTCLLNLRVNMLRDVDNAGWPNPFPDGIKIPGTVVGAEGYSLIFLSNAAQLQVEAIIMRHCVDKLPIYCFRDRLVVAAMKKGEDSIATLCLQYDPDRKRLEKYDFSGYGDSNPTEEMKLAAQWFIDEYTEEFPYDKLEKARIERNGSSNFEFGAMVYVGFDVMDDEKVRRLFKYLLKLSSTELKKGIRELASFEDSFAINDAVVELDKMPERIAKTKEPKIISKEDEVRRAEINQIAMAARLARFQELLDEKFGSGAVIIQKNKKVGLIFSSDNPEILKYIRDQLQREEYSYAESFYDEERGELQIKKIQQKQLKRAIIGRSRGVASPEALALVERGGRSV